MKLIAARPEYQIAVEPDKNRVFYQNFGAMQTAVQLPFYLADWHLTLQEVQPGFTILADLEFVNQTGSAALPPVFQAAEELLRQHGVRLVAEVHVPGEATHLLTDAVNIGTLPVRSFLDLLDAAQYLDELLIGPSRPYYPM
ncbi:hypothetical protein GCM10023185_01820 [Hymenobacter saemangeumensis]|uniref:Uncharacterized protein n=1 Tax=Hymenobacter saemangeumensis TaxID=1084522 RepID=A0ABP8HXN3_9BACT